MRDRGPLLVLVAILAVLGVRALPPAETKSAGNGKTANADPVNPLPSFSGSPDSMAADFWHPLRDFWETTPGEKASSTASWLGFPDVPGYNLEFLIATVPDPFDSTSGYRFDAHVDAILRAVETQDFVQDGFWFPWRAGEPRPNTSATATAKAIATVSAAGEPRTKASDKATSAPNDENDQSNRLQTRLYERQPGAILFRSVHNEGAT